MKSINVINELDFEYDRTKSYIVNTYNFAVCFLEKTDKDDTIRTRVIQHTLRTMKIADKILKKEIADRQIIMLSLLLHDIGKTITESRHDLVSYNIAQIYLQYTDLSDEVKKRILDCILYHSAKNLKQIDLTIEQKIVMDADILDEIGVLSIIKYCIKINMNRDINEIIKHLDDVYSKIDKESSLVRTKYGKELYAQKKNKFREILDLLKSEASMFTIK